MIEIWLRRSGGTMKAGVPSSIIKENSPSAILPTTNPTQTIGRASFS